MKTITIDSIKYEIQKDSNSKDILNRVLDINLEKIQELTSNPLKHLDPRWKKLLHFYGVTKNEELVQILDNRREQLQSLRDKESLPSVLEWKLLEGPWLDLIKYTLFLLEEHYLEYCPHLGEALDKLWIDLLKTDTITTELNNIIHINTIQ